MSSSKRRRAAARDVGARHPNGRAVDRVASNSALRASGSYTDTAGLDRACRIARALGFDGKQCIHPAQLATVNAAFSPSAGEVTRANAIVDAYERTVATGQGAATHEGRMIDAANLRMARTILERHRSIGAR